ncbi:hypothetical protein V6N12_034829 [Hibiscus sabdariffa]|uniref:Reverse transcriptase zinc-binding domain-containing protein n=1 Tax=Hibiscus sabdariffa TaxID=183260 RepID=A0ABR2BNL1_9ROSI
MVRQGALAEETTGVWKILHKFRGLPRIRSCQVCGDAAEDVDHVFRQCPLAIQIWSDLIRGDRLDSFLTMPFLSWIVANLSKASLGVHSKHAVTAQMAAIEWFRAMTPVCRERFRPPTTWSTLLEHWIKINNDGGWCGANGRGSCGGVARDSIGAADSSYWSSWQSGD